MSHPDVLDHYWSDQTTNEPVHDVSCLGGLMYLRNWLRVIILGIWNITINILASNNGSVCVGSVQGCTLPHAHQHFFPALIGSHHLAEKGHTLASFSHKSATTWPVSNKTSYYGYGIHVAHMYWKPSPTHAPGFDQMNCTSNVFKTCYMHTLNHTARLISSI